MPVIGTNDAAKQFIYEQLSLWAINVEIEIKKQLIKREIEATGDLMNSLTFKVFQASTGNSGRYQLTFKEYGRMVDMGKGRLKIESIDSNTQIIKSKQKKRKPQKWYSKTVYGMIYGNLLERVQEAWLNNSNQLVKQALLQP